MALLGSEPGYLTQFASYFFFAYLDPIVRSCVRMRQNLDDVRQEGYVLSEPICRCLPRLLGKNLQGPVCRWVKVYPAAPTYFMGKTQITKRSAACSHHVHLLTTHSREAREYRGDHSCDGVPELGRHTSQRGWGVMRRCPMCAVFFHEQTLSLGVGRQKFNLLRMDGYGGETVSSTLHARMELPEHSNRLPI